MRTHIAVLSESLSPARNDSFTFPFTFSSASNNPAANADTAADTATHTNTGTGPNTSATVSADFDTHIFADPSALTNFELAFITCPAENARVGTTKIQYVAQQLRFATVTWRTSPSDSGNTSLWRRSTTACPGRVRVGMVPGGLLG